MTFMPRWEDIVEALQSADVAVVDRAWELLLILAEADSSIMVPFDVLEISISNGMFGPDCPSIVSWIDSAVHRERIVVKALVWLYEQGVEFSSVSFDGWTFEGQVPEELAQLQAWGIVFVYQSGGSA
ncbi:MAG: hypothetical protein CMK59_07540 [Proteobacteria bacterium]|nr:hypothetical protein [Pseudomonadota bacterium]